MATDRPVIWNHDNADHRRAFATAIAPIVAVLWKRKDPFSRTDAVIYMRTLKYVPSVILVQAVEKLLETETWFPEPSKFLSVAADLIDAQRLKVWQGLKDSDCEYCHGTRWEEVTVDEGHTRLRRCGCWTRAMQLMNEIGVPIERPKLVAHDPDDAA